MKRILYEGSFERSMIFGMLTNKELLFRLRHIDTSLFPQSYVKILIDKIFGHYQKWGDAPGMDLLVGISQDPSLNGDGELISGLVKSLEEDEQPVLNNAAFMAEEVNTYLLKLLINKKCDAAKAAVLRGDTIGALDALKEIKPAESGLPIGFSIDDDTIEDAFSENELDPLIEYGGDAGEFFNDKLTRCSLVVPQASEKKGKTWWCIEFAFRAFRSRRRVAIFSTGDLTKRQLTRRVLMRLVDAPLRKNDCGDIEYPEDIKLVQGTDGDWESQVQTCTKPCPQPISKIRSRAAKDDFCKKFRIKKMKSLLQMHCCSSNSINVRGIETVLDRWRIEDDFIPDVIIVDYADILAPENPRGDPQERWNDTWLALNRLRQDRQACVIAPTQANAGSYKATTMDLGHFSRDKRKYAHATAVLGLNQTPAEKKKGIMRLNWLLVRESDSNPKECLYVAQCAKLGRMLVKAVLPHEFRNKDN